MHPSAKSIRPSAPMPPFVLGILHELLATLPSDNNIFHVQVSTRDGFCHEFVIQTRWELQNRMVEGNNCGVT